ncbi:hypothetical protein Tco_0104717 [Tanacetum coccineum]
MFWTEAVRTACYVLNRVLVTSPYNKTPYALLTGNIPSVSHFKSLLGVSTIRKQVIHLGKFDGNADECYIVGYSASNRAYRVYNVPNKRELARLKGQVTRATSAVKDAEELQQKSRTQTVPTGSIPVPAGSIEIPSGRTTISPGNVSVPTSGVPVPTGSPTDSFFDDEPIPQFPSPSDLGNNEPSLGIFSSTSYDDEFGADLNNLASTMEVSPVATNRINTIHPRSLILGDHILAVQTRSKVNKTTTGESAFISYIHDSERKIIRLSILSVYFVPFQVDQEVYLKTLKIQAGWIACRKKCNIASIEAIRCSYAFALPGIYGFIRWMLECIFIGRIDEEVLVTQTLRDLWILNIQEGLNVVKAYMDLHKHQELVYVDDIIFGSTKKAWCDEFEALRRENFKMSIVQEILKKFDLECVRTATTPYEALKPKSKNELDNLVNVHLYRNQVNSTTSNLEAVKKIFKYLKGQPKLGLWYPRESPFVLEAYSDSDYARANKDRKSTTGGCQFLGRRLISWQCKKQTIVATSSTEAKYVVAANCCGQDVHTGSSSVPSGVTRVPTGSFHFSYW